jgi:hypothetical protein
VARSNAMGTRIDQTSPEGAPESMCMCYPCGFLGFCGGEISFWIEHLTTLKTPKNVCPQASVMAVVLAAMFLAEQAVRPMRSSLVSRAAGSQARALGRHGLPSPPFPPPRLLQGESRPHWLAPAGARGLAQGRKQLAPPAPRARAQAGPQSSTSHRLPDGPRLTPRPARLACACAGARGAVRVAGRAGPVGRGRAFLL